MLRLVAVLIAALGLVVTGYFWFKGETVAILFTVAVLVPVLAVFRRNTALLLVLAALSVVTGFTSCAANFRWGGG
jgi:hypothetical protein